MNLSRTSIVVVCLIALAALGTATPAASRPLTKSSARQSSTTSLASSLSRVATQTNSYGLGLQEREEIQSQPAYCSDFAEFQSQFGGTMQIPDACTAPPVLRGNPYQPLPAEDELEPPDLRAYDLFEASYDSDSLLQARLLVAAAMYIYPSTKSFDSESVFKEAMAEFGMEAEYLVIENTGTEVGVVWNDDIVIVTFSGTTFGGDFWTDMQMHMQRMPASWGPNVLVHDGFAGAWKSVSNFVIDEVEGLVEDGRTLWLTGHSLGGALATLAAFELQQVHDIPVEGVHTFGSPRAAGIRFAQIYSDIGLSDVTQRWVIDGDPVPNLIDSYSLVRFSIFRAPSIRTWNYEHVGITYKVYKHWGTPGPGPDFELQRDADDGEYPYSASGFLNEHVQYDDALDQLLGNESDDATMELMPAVNP